MKILTADYLLCCDDDFTIMKDAAICFDEKIIEVGKKDEVIKNNPYAIVKNLSPNSIIMPGLVNTHVHLEYSANQTTLVYGDFIKWLQSVIKNREFLQRSCDKKCYNDAVEQMLQSGVTTFGAISSFGGDLEICYETPLKVVYFNEILGSNPDFADDIYKDFEKRLQQSFDMANDTLKPAVSIHSPYSTHPMIAKYAIDLAKENDLNIATHFMESKAEREWLDKGSGDFYNFMKNFNHNPKPMTNAMSFLKMFEGLNTVFVHGNMCNEEELEFISKNGSLSSCVVSNRLLNNPVLDIKKAENKDVKITIGTDGLSSNNSLNIWNEMRAFLFSHNEANVIELSKNLIKYATINGAKALGIFDGGELKKEKNADIVSIVLPNSITDIEQLPLELILHTKEIKSGYINGERYV
ncbi:MAG: metal-dependent hydrolase [Epsilonproteobacteria bacterium]|nr:metal-dependent hydrolase [Campylobacterota bacterium]